VDETIKHPDWDPGILSDRQIAHLAEQHDMIAPFEAGPVRDKYRCECPCPPEKHGSAGCNTWYGDKNTGHGCGCDYGRPNGRVISYGLGHYGYDIRVAREFKVFTSAFPKPGEAVVDPKGLDDGCMVDYVDDVVRIPPNSFVLARSVERFNIPRDVLAIVLGKSTYARCGLIVNCTPLEPEWRGYITLEISNTTPLPAKVYANEGIAQVLFYKASQTCRTSYADKKGKYQDQGPEVVSPRV